MNSIEFYLEKNVTKGRIGMREYSRKVMPAVGTSGKWQQLADDFQTKWKFPLAFGALDGKHVGIKCPNDFGTLTATTKDFCQSHYWPTSTQTTSSYGSDLVEVLPTLNSSTILNYEKFPISTRVTCFSILTRFLLTCQKFSGRKSDR